MSLGGYIKLHRKLREWEWYSEVNVKVLFLHCLISANFKNANWKGVSIKRGQFITTYASLENEISLSTQQLRTAFAKLKNTKEINTESTGKYLLVTVVKFDVYQSLEDYEQQDNNILPTGLQQGINTIPTGLQQQRNNDKNNKEEKELKEEEKGGEEKKEPTHPSISEFNILEKKLELALQEIELLKAEKEKEKSCEKKEKEVLGGDALLPTPPHKTDALQSAWYSADESNNLKPYQLKIKDYPFKNWSKELKEAFDAFCEGEYDRSNKKFSGTQAKELIRVVEMDLDKHGTEKVENCLRLCALRQWAYEIDYQLNREKRQIEDSKPKNNNKKPLHNNDLVMKGESLNHLNKWNKAK